MVVYDMAAKHTHVSGKNRVSGHFEPDAAQSVGLRTGQAAGLAGLGASHGSTDIAADSLEIANADNLATFQGTVIVAQRGNKLTGERLDIDMTKRHMTMTGPGRVSGTFTPDASPVANAKAPMAAAVESDVAAPGNSFASLAAASSGEPTNIEADKLYVQDDVGLATFTGKVLVVRGGDRISAEALTVEYVASGTAAATQPGTQLKLIRAKDHVVVHTPDNQVASGDSLLYDPGHNKLSIGGNVTISQGKNVVRCERLIVDLLTGKSDCQNPGNAAPSGQTQAQAAASALQGVAAAPQGRASAVFFPSSNGQAGGPMAPQINAINKPKQDMSASDVMVAPFNPQ